VQTRQLSGKAARSQRARRQLLVPLGLAISALLVGVAPAACLSDATPPPCVQEQNCRCVQDHTCRGGGAGQAPDSGNAGELPQGGGPGGDFVAVLPTDFGPDASNTVASAGRGGQSSTLDGGTLEGVAGICDTCVLDPPELPNPCGSDHYSTSLSIDGGISPYQWRVSATTGTWRIAGQPNSTDDSQVTLSGDPSGAADLTVTVSDAAGYEKSGVYSIVPRSACYFAFVAPGTNGPMLALRDPLLAIDATGNLTSNQGVHDFQFSPDGRFLVYRYGEGSAHPTGAHLSLLDLSTMQDQALDFQEDTVDAYAWSPDAAVLAVAFTASEQSELSGIRPASAASGAAFTTLTSTVASDPVESNLYWVDSSLVAFYSATTPDLLVPPGFASVFYAPLEAGGFDAPQPIQDTAYAPGIVVMPAPGGLFITTPAAHLSWFNSISVDDVFDENNRQNIVDPAGRFSAAVLNNALQLFQAADNSAPFETSGTDAASDCPKLLTWARNRERIACVAHVSQTATSWGEIRIFDAGSITPLVLAPSVVQGSCLKDANGVPIGGPCPRSVYDYDEPTSVAQPRLLSASGNWLAFVTGAQSGTSGVLYWTDLTAKPISLSRQVGTSITLAGSAVALAFSPSERYLLHQNGDVLIAHLLSAGPLDGGDLPIESSLGAPTTAPCSEDFVTAPTSWCGGANGSPSFAWSPDSAFDVFAYRKLDQLIVVELSGQTSIPHPMPASACDATCSGQYAFQPPRP
jgi:hypothetical protein